MDATTTTGNKTDADAGAPPLTTLQQRRVNALKAARQILAVFGIASVDVFDVIRLADYILTGDPDA